MAGEMIEGRLSETISAIGGMTDEMTDEMIGVERGEMITDETTDMTVETETAEGRAPLVEGVHHRLVRLLSASFQSPSGRVS
jgi:hypothetical protein